MSTESAELRREIIRAGDDVTRTRTALYLNRKELNRRISVGKPEGELQFLRCEIKDQEERLTRRVAREAELKARLTELEQPVAKAADTGKTEVQ